MRNPPWLHHSHEIKNKDIKADYKKYFIKSFLCWQNTGSFNRKVLISTPISHFHVKHLDYKHSVIAMYYISMYMAAD